MILETFFETSVLHQEKTEQQISKKTKSKVSPAQALPNAKKKNQDKPNLLGRSHCRSCGGWKVITTQGLLKNSPIICRCAIKDFIILTNRCVVDSVVCLPLDDGLAIISRQGHK